MNSLMCTFLVVAMVPPTKAGADAAQKSAGDSAVSAVDYMAGAKKSRDFQTARIAASYAKYLAVKGCLNETDAFFLGLSFTKLDTQVASCDGYITAGEGCIDSGTGHVETATVAYNAQKWGEAIDSYNSAFAEYENAGGNYKNANESISDDLIALVEQTLKGY